MGTCAARIKATSAVKAFLSVIVTAAVTASTVATSVVSSAPVSSASTMSTATVSTATVSTASTVCAFLALERDLHVRDRFSEVASLCWGWTVAGECGSVVVLGQYGRW